LACLVELIKQSKLLNLGWLVAALFAGEIVLVEKARILGLLLRYGFVWRNGVSVPAEDNTTLEKILKSKYTPLL
jgi:hypothetical protein